ncbi:DUF6731 family protein [Oricola sp.]|uniref:DUF6731 family protein n=1 Tax=Oricola sp. TaxID=1979950 RepID=UPI003BA9BDD4
MDRVVRARFFQVENVSAHDATFFDCLTRLWEHGRRETYQEIFGGIRVRLERFSPEIDADGFVEGEFVRQQQENVPPIAQDELPLEGTDDPVGHRCAFRYLPAINALLLESRRETLTPMRIDAFVKARIQRHKGFFISPILSETALERLRNGTPRKVRMRVARPNELAQVEGDPLDIEDNLARFQEFLGGPNIEVSAGFPKGHHEGRLNLGNLNELVRWATNRRGNVEHLSVKILEEAEPIDIFSEQIKVMDELELDNRDVERHYATRRDYLRQAFRDYRPVIERIYGRGD